MKIQKKKSKIDLMINKFDEQGKKLKKENKFSFDSEKLFIIYIILNKIFYYFAIIFFTFNLLNIKIFKGNIIFYTF